MPTVPLPITSPGCSITSWEARSIIWPNGWIGPEASLKGSILGRNCHVGRSAVIESPVVLGDKTVITDYSRI